MQTLLAMIVLAQGVTGDGILVGMEGAAASFSVDEENLGMRLVMRDVNARGGIHGRLLVEKSYPRDPADTVASSVANARRLAEQDGVFLLFNFGGPAAIGIGAYAMQHDVPYLFPHTALLTVDGDRHVFTSYPRYVGETRIMLSYLAKTLGRRRIGVIAAPNAYGDLFRNQAESLAAELGYAFAGAVQLDDDVADARDAVATLRDAGADTVVMALYPAGARKVVQAKAALDWNVGLVSTGPLSDEQYLNVDGGQAEGTLGFCYYPDPNASNAPGVVRYRELMARHFPGHPLNRYSLYGYVFGLLIVEGLERAGRDLTEDGFLDAMESIRDWDSGDIMPAVSFSASNHHAQTAGFICELRDGRFMPLSGWIEP